MATSQQTAAGAKKAPAAKKGEPGKGGRLAAMQWCMFAHPLSLLTSPCCICVVTALLLPCPFASHAAPAAAAKPKAPAAKPAAKAAVEEVDLLDSDDEAGPSQRAAPPPAAGAPSLLAQTALSQLQQWRPACLGIRVANCRKPS